jgi:hypothetical protein
MLLLKPSGTSQDLNSRINGGGILVRSQRKETRPTMRTIILSGYIFRWKADHYHV